MSNGISLLLILSLSFAAVAQPTEVGWTCQVEGSDDHFVLYPSQRVLRSERFDVFALMGGLTLATVARDSGRFYRITQLNLLPQPDRMQQFVGYCQPLTGRR